MAQIFLALAAALADLSLALRAFVCHFLKSKLTESTLATFEKGIRGKMSHALALLFVALLLQQAQESQISLLFAEYSFIIGIVTFGGSLYSLSARGIKCMGKVVPFGSWAFLVK